MSQNEQVVTPEIIVQAFEFLGGDPNSAIESAGNFSSVETWKYWQASQAALVGAAAVSIPVAHLPLIAVDVIFLLHKMAYCCWGIGAIHKCKIESKEDFAVILGLYTGVVTEHALYASIGTGTLTLAGGLIANMGLPVFMGKVAGKGVGLGAKALGATLGSKAILKGVGKTISASAPLIGAISGKVAEKFTAKLATKAAFKTALNSAAGFLPVLGALAAGGVNIYFVNSIASSADTYYRAKKKATT